jgi:glycosyltransferase involved in cell wall biosynthesis
MPVDTPVIQTCLPRPFRVAVLWTGLSGYLAACLRELQTHDVEIFVAHSQITTDAPFSPHQFAFFDQSFPWDGSPEPATLMSEIKKFSPDAIVVAGWHVPGYRSVLRHYRHGIPRVLCMDNQWHGSAKQRAGVLISRFYVQVLCDLVWVPGERQSSFAERLGFAPSQILRGMYCCDFDRFSVIHNQYAASAARRPECFLFAGRLVDDKGVDTLIEAYQIYRKLTGSPWPLICCGTGPKKEKLSQIPGVILKGFVQPNDLPGALGDAACFVLPSRFEPWGVVLHEAAAAGLPIITSSAVGSSVHLVQDGYNGFLFTPGDAQTLAQLLAKVSDLGLQKRLEMGAASHLLARQLTPDRWASYLLDRITDFRKDIQ